MKTLTYILLPVLLFISGCSNELYYREIEADDITVKTLGNQNTLLANGQSTVEIEISFANEIPPDQSIMVHTSNGLLYTYPLVYGAGNDTLTITPRTEQVVRVVLQSSTVVDTNVVFTLKVNSIRLTEKFKFERAAPNQLQLEASSQLFDLNQVSEIALTANLFNSGEPNSTGTRVNFEPDLEGDTSNLQFFVSWDETVIASNNEAVSTFKLLSIPDSATIADAPSMIRFFAVVDASQLDAGESVMDSIDVLIIR